MLERVPFPLDAVGRFDLAAHPIVRAEGQRDHGGEHRIERKDQKVGPDLPDQEVWLDQDDGDGAEERPGEEDQRVKDQPQSER